jgi:hypothetical protein
VKDKEMVAEIKKLCVWDVLALVGCADKIMPGSLVCERLSSPSVCKNRRPGVSRSQPADVISGESVHIEVRQPDAVTT